MLVLSEIKNLLKLYSVKPSKAKGQNFLIAENVLAKIVNSADLDKNDFVIEIGPGLGILTQELVKNCKKVLAVELDKQLIYFLKNRFKGVKNLEILEGDILKFKNSDLIKKLGGEGKYKIVANLPYSITKPVIRKFLTYLPRPQAMVVLVQKEVAQKITAKSGKLNLLGLSVQFYGQPEIMGLVEKENFYPQPEVESAILKIKVRQGRLPQEVEQVLAEDKISSFQEKKFWQLIKIGFSSPRKQLQNNLATGLKLSNLSVKNKLKECGLKEEIRAQDLNLRDWACLYLKFVV